MRLQEAVYKEVKKSGEWEGFDSVSVQTCIGKLDWINVSVWKGAEHILAYYTQHRVAGKTNKELLPLIMAGLRKDNK